MRVIIILGAFFCATLACVSCKKPMTGDGEVVSLLGKWNNVHWNSNGEVAFERANDFEEDVYGLEFSKGKKFIEWKFSAWCGTGPTRHSEWKGKWKREENLLQVTISNWNGEEDEQWEIISLSEDHLILKMN